MYVGYAKKLRLLAASQMKAECHNIHFHPVSSGFLVGTGVIQDCKMRFTEVILVLMRTS